MKKNRAQSSKLGRSTLYDPNQQIRQYISCEPNLIRKAAVIEWNADFACQSASMMFLRETSKAGTVLADLEAKLISLPQALDT